MGRQLDTDAAVASILHYGRTGQRESTGPGCKFEDPMSTFLGAIIALVAYFIPTILALRRDHPKAGSIFLLNLLAGWTILGYAGALFLVWNGPVVTEQDLLTAQAKRKASDRKKV